MPPAVVGDHPQSFQTGLDLGVADQDQFLRAFGEEQARQRVADRAGGADDRNTTIRPSAIPWLSQAASTACIADQVV